MSGDLSEISFRILPRARIWAIGYLLILPPEGTYRTGTSGDILEVIGTLLRISACHLLLSQYFIMESR